LENKSQHCVFLTEDKLIKAALDSKADAIHPGYGFLSENASFAARVASAQLTFIGPPADSIRLMGDKASVSRTGA
jgi:acetyl/propionyl-CoA carboxylase alpha subunit